MTKMNYDRPQFRLRGQRHEVPAPDLGQQFLEKLYRDRQMKRGSRLEQRYWRTDPHVASIRGLIGATSGKSRKCKTLRDLLSFAAKLFKLEAGLTAQQTAEAIKAMSQSERLAAVYGPKLKKGTIDIVNTPIEIPFSLKKWIEHDVRDIATDEFFNTPESFRAEVERRLADMAQTQRIINAI